MYVILNFELIIFFVFLSNFRLKFKEIFAALNFSKLYLNKIC